MIGYTCVGTHDLDKAVTFYSDLLGIFFIIGNQLPHRR